MLRVSVDVKSRRQDQRWKNPAASVPAEAIWCAESANATTAARGPIANVPSTDRNKSARTANRKSLPLSTRRSRRIYVTAEVTASAVNANVTDVPIRMRLIHL